MLWLGQGVNINTSSTVLAAAPQAWTLAPCPHPLPFPGAPLFTFGSYSKSLPGTLTLLRSTSTPAWSFSTHLHQQGVCVVLKCCVSVCIWVCVCVYLGVSGCVCVC